jgi:putative hydrolase of the HAD superfamily
MAELLDEAKARSLRLAVISDGFLGGQRQKVRALGLSRWFDPILLTDAWGRPCWKPHPRAFLKIQARYGFSPEELVYIGDNPAKDFQAPNRLGWNTIHLVMPGQCARGPLLDPAGSRAEGLEELGVRILGARG